MVICKECNREFETLDALRRHRVQKHKVSAEQTYIDYVLDGIEPKCKCGCNEKPKFLGVEVGFRDYKLGHASRVNNNWGHNPNAIKKSHETQKKMHENGELTIWNKGLTIEDDRVRDNITKVMSNPERGNNISKKLTGVAKSQEHIKKIKEHSKLRWENPEEREKQSNRRMEYIIKNGFTPTSKLEETFEKILIDNFNFKLDKDYYYQFYVRKIKAIFDFKISGKKILIEVDGDYWHCNPNSRYAEPTSDAQIGNLIQDKIKSEWCIENGFKLLRFWESDIKNDLESVIKKLKEELL